MPRLGVALIAVAFAAAAVVCHAAAVSNTGKAPQVLLLGRFEPGPEGDSSIGELPQLMTWPASSATVSFTNTGSVTVAINGSLEAFPAGDIINLILEENPIFPWAFFQFDVDGTTVGVGSVSASEPVLTWTHSGMVQGPHNLTITKLSEARMGAAWLESISIDASGDFLEPPPSPGMRTGRRMLFVGDSFTWLCEHGWRKLPTIKCFQPNALLGYGPIAAQHLEADYQILAWSGAGVNVYPGLRQGSLFSREVEMAYYPLDSELIYRQDALNPTSSYSADSWVPQVVILAGGTNDFHNTTLSEDHHVDDPALPPVHEWVDMYLDYVQQVRQLYPEAAIINLVWPLEVQLVGVLTPEQATVYLQYMAAAYSRLQMAGLSDIYMLQLTGEDIDSSNWCSYHPDAAADALIAGQLIQFIESVLPSLGPS